MVVSHYAVIMILILIQIRTTDPNKNLLMGGRVRTSPWKVSDLTEKLPKAENSKQDYFSYEIYQWQKRENNNTN